MKKLIATTSKNEIDMDCWIDYHLTLGFDIVVLDDNDDPTIESLDGVTVLRDISDDIKNNPPNFYNYVIKNYQNYDWIALLDCDEYLVYNSNYTLDEILDKYKDFAAVCPNWIFFGNNGHKKIPKGRVFENFLMRQDDSALTTKEWHPCKHVKVIVQPKLVKEVLSGHCIIGEKPSISVNMDLIEDARDYKFECNICPVPTDHMLWINHYFCKSKEHWTSKINRGYWGPRRRPQEDWDKHNFNEAFDDRCLQLYNKLRKNKLEIITFIKDEEDLIYNFLQHHSKIVDKITIIDHNSTDNTSNIINNFISSNKNIDIQLLNYRGDFENKGTIVSFYIQNSKADIVIPLDADELIVYDNDQNISDDPKKIKEYLCNLDIKSCKYQIRSIYNKLPESKTEFCKQNDILHPKIFVPKIYFSSINCGYHECELIDDNAPTEVSNISYIHMHYTSKNIWLKNSQKKLKARLGEKYEDIEEIKKLANSQNKSHITAKEFVEYLTTDNWNNLTSNTFLETPHLTFDIKSV
jgi:hypothetical protein